MAQWKFIGAGVALSTLLASTAVLADVTAEEVWQGWADYYTAFGYEMAVGSQSKDGGTLALTDVVFTSTLPDGTATFTLPEIQLAEQGDGTVEVTMSEKMLLDIATTTPAEDGAEAEVVTMAMALRQTDMTTRVSGTPDNMAYDISAPELVLEMDEVVTNGEAVPMKLRLALADSSGTYGVTKAAGQAIKSAFNTAKLDFTVSAADPDTGQTFNMSGDMADLVMLGDIVLPEGLDMNDMAGAMNLGMKMAGSFSYGAGNYAVDFHSLDGPGSITTSADSGNFAFAMSKEGMSYGAGGTNTQFAMTAPDIPFPVNASIDETVVNFAIPVAKTDAPAPFAMAVKLVGLKVSDEVWGMFDPTAQLPRDPATLIVDLAGSAQLTMDLFDPAMAESQVPPGEINTLDVKELQVTVAGTELTGAGAMTFDNSMGMPKPLGSIDLKLAGANALMDKLVAMGMMPEDQVMGARMMMGLFAVPTGDDEVTSKIEFKEDGGVYANGQRLQ